MILSTYKVFATIVLWALCIMPVLAEQQVGRYATVIFPFAEKGGYSGDFGKRISDELTANLFDSDEVELIDQQQVRSDLGDSLPLASEMISLAAANEIANLTGAKVVVTGIVLRSGDSIIIVSRIISTETNRVFMESIRGHRDDADLLMGDLVVRVTDVINLYLEKLVI